MSNQAKSIALLGAVAMMSSQNENMYSSKNNSATKTPLSKKQKKARSKSKAARKARRR